MVALVDHLGFLAVGGFLLGVFLYTGWYTTRYEPEVKYGYAILGAGVFFSVCLSVWIDFHHEIADWLRILVVLGYAVIAAGLTVILIERRNEKR